MKELEQNFIEWAKARGIYEHSDAKSQLLKGVSEMGELADAVCKGQHEKIVDGIGDVIVCLTHVAFMSGTDLTECMHKAWQDIKDRKGRMVAGGVFVKDESEPSKREKILPLLQACEHAWDRMQCRGTKENILAFEDARQKFWEALE